MRGDNNVSLHPLLSYGVCLERIGKQSDARQVANELHLLCKESDSDLDKDDLAPIYYEIDDFTAVVDMYSDTKLGFSTYWIPQYLYALHQCGDNTEIKDVFDKVLLYFENEIAETIQDDNEDWEEGRKSEYIEELKNYYPSTESNCYLFGCIRHNNSSFTEQ